ncbi:hypothetical protein DR999_PMT16503 [Platysternon megacephalum]|uniref:Uncharacterized protein n=1 Tax=Platysternon megacephalum TaxID=55544 RepID=A0A4D9DXB4_9SAUR|nr:hypothetical protein DR999_PMT16503 [Platysternon megacephalum]
MDSGGLSKLVSFHSAEFTGSVPCSSWVLSLHLSACPTQSSAQLYTEASRTSGRRPDSVGQTMTCTHVTIGGIRKMPLPKVDRDTVKRETFTVALANLQHVNEQHEWSSSNSSSSSEGS